ncbi:perilipin-3-like [Zootoca vivipara]|uniref:perilipin-3-like n=1 Tax=Zootoca vivipara TaxID=8524 RepID=UPI0015906733|nr:perilipin-3-like [Zootoca vivipara]
MSNNKGNGEAASHEITEKGQQCVIQRLTDLPLVSITYEILSTTYNSAKGSHPAIHAVCGMTEAGVKKIASSAVSGAQPVLNKLEPQIASANAYACQGLDKLQETLPVVQQTIEKVVLDAKGLVLGAKDTVSGLAGGVKEATQEKMKMAVSAVVIGMNTMMEGNMKQMVTSGIDHMIEASEEMIEYYLPVTDEELAALAASVVINNPEEATETAPVKKEKEEESYYQRLGALSAFFRHRVYQSSLAKMQRIKRSTREILFQLQEAVLLIKYTLQSLDRQLNPNVANHQKEMEPILVEWNGSLPMPSQSYEERLLEQAESQALSLTYGISQQMQNICQRFLANAQGLPVALLEKVQQTYNSMEELQATLSGAKSLKDLPSGNLKESQEKIEKAQETIFETMEHVIMTTWGARPFFPAQTSMVESEKEAKAEA